MNRKIKFRAWDKEHSKMLFEFANTTDLNEFLSNGNQGLYEFMQFTGLLDKNGKEIYEGDIISTPQYETRYAEVVWIGNHFGMGFSMLHDDIPVDMEDDWSEFEIIGNIYENPELLK